MFVTFDWCELKGIYKQLSTWNRKINPLSFQEARNWPFPAYGPAERMKKRRENQSFPQFLRRQAESTFHRLDGRVRIAAATPRWAISSQLSGDTLTNDPHPQYFPSKINWKMFFFLKTEVEWLPGKWKRIPPELDPAERIPQCRHLNCSRTRKRKE